MKKEEQALCRKLPCLSVANSEHLEHEGALDGTFGVVASNVLLVDPNALSGNRVRVPVMLLLFVALGKLQEPSHQLVLTQIAHVVQVDQDLIPAHLLVIDVIVDGSGLARDRCLLRQCLDLEAHGLRAFIPRFLEVEGGAASLGQLHAGLINIDTLLSQA